MQFAGKMVERAKDAYLKRFVKRKVAEFYALNGLNVAEVEGKTLKELLELLNKVMAKQQLTIDLLSQQNVQKSEIIKNLKTEVEGLVGENKELKQGFFNLNEKYQKESGELLKMKTQASAQKRKTNLQEAGVKKQSLSL